MDEFRVRNKQTMNIFKNMVTGKEEKKKLKYKDAKMQESHMNIIACAIFYYPFLVALILENNKNCYLVL